MRAIKMIVAALALQGAIEASAQTQLFHPTTSTWRYLTDSAVQQAAGANWVTSGYDDSSWLSGTGLFGNDTGYPYPMNTTIAAGTAAPFIAVYYRSHFTWNGTTAGVVLTGTNYVDDGSIIYLNGVEIARFNMPASANAATPNEVAPTANPGGFPNVNGGEPVLVQLAIELDALTNLNVNPLVTGDNIVAVQVHQNASSSSDRVFGLALYGSQAVAPCFTGTQPTNRTILVGRSTTFVANQTCGIPAPTFQWFRNVGIGEETIAGATASTYTLANATEADSGQYYVRASNSKGTATSPVANLTVTSDTIAPKLVSGRLGANTTEMIVVADEPLCADDLLCAGNATLSYNWQIYVEGDELQQLGIAGITVNGNTLTFTLDGQTPWVTDTRYVIGLLPLGNGSIGDLYGNILTGDDANSSVTTAAAASAISVKAPGGSDLYTFDVGPSAAEFSTFTWTGAAGDAATVAAFDSASKALDASLITERLAEATGNPPGTDVRSRYASETRNLITRPTGVLGNALIAHLRNDTGFTTNGLTITYNLTDRATGTAEEIAGHLVFFSTSGAANTWTQVGGDAYNNGATGLKTAIIDLRSSPWAAGSDLYVLFTDDNAAGTEGIYEIDNFKVTLGGVVVDNTPPTLTRAISTDSTTIALSFSEPMAASAGTTAPYAVSGATVSAAVLSGDGRQVTLTTSARSVGTSTVTITGLRDASSEANLTAPNPIVFSLTTVQKVIDWNVAWEYITNSLDSEPTWTTTGGTGWQTGNALFGTETSSGIVAIMPTPIATVIPPPNTANDFMVTYLRKSITLPALPAGQSYAINHLTDDGVVFYLDGNEIGRYNMPAGAVTHSTVAVAGIEASFQSLLLPATSGNHVLAARVHQNGNTSSDMLFGAAIYAVPTASPALTIVNNQGTNVVTWNSDTSWVLNSANNVAGPYTAVAGNPYRRFSAQIPATQTNQFYKLHQTLQP